MDDEIPEHWDSLTPVFSWSISTVFILISLKNRNCEVCQRTKITRAPYRRRNDGVVLRAENFWWLDHSRSHGDLITADHKVLSENSESRNNHRRAIVNKNFTGNTEKLAKVLGGRSEVQSHLPRQIFRIWQSLWRSLLESLFVDNLQIRNKWDCWKAVRREKKDTKTPLLYCRNQV